MRASNTAWTLRASALALGLTAALATSACAGPHTVVNTSTPPAGAAPRGIMVNGSGKATGKPNIARASVGVEVRAFSADAAIRDANARMAQVVNALKQFGIAERDLRTMNVSLQFERSFETPPRPVEPAAPVAQAPAPQKAVPQKRPAGTGVSTPATPPAAPEPTLPKPVEGVYRAANQLEVTIRDLEQAGAVLSAATNAGANELFGIQFELEDPRALEAEARQKAYADAQARATALAQLSGLKLGPPVSIQEMGGGGVMQSSAPMMSMMKESGGNAPIERGELSVYTNVQVVFTLPEN